jgi:hypothetical protein
MFCINNEGGYISTYVGSLASWLLGAVLTVKFTLVPWLIMLVASDEGKRVHAYPSAIFQNIKNI